MPERFGEQPGPETALGHQGEAEWHRLRQQLALAEGFWLGFLFTTSPVVTRTFRQRTERILRSRALSLQTLRPETTGELERILPRLFDPEPNTGCLWLEAPRVDSPGTAEDEPGSWIRAWDQLLLRLNERRDRLRRTLDCGLVLVAHPRIKPRVRDAAPDLWSVRSIVLEPNPGPVDAPTVRSGEAFERDRRQERPIGDNPYLSPGFERTSYSPETPTEVREPEAEYGEDPEDPAAASAKLLRRAAGDLQAGHSRSAIHHAVRAIEILDSIRPPEGPDRAGAYALLAEAELADDDPAAAEGHLRRAIELLEDPLDRRALTWLDMLDEIAWGHCDSASSIHLCREQVDRARSRAWASEKESPTNLKDLSLSLQKLGDALYSGGDFEGAAAAFQESFLILRRTSGAHEEQYKTLRDLARSLARLGDVLRLAGELEEALTAFEGSLRLVQQIVDEHGESPEALRDLSVCLNMAGEVFQEQGDIVRAKESFQESLAIRRALLRDHGESPGRLRDVSICLERIGDALLLSRDFERAAKVFQECLQLRRNILRSYGPSLRLLREVALSWDRFGNVLRELAELDEAVLKLRESLRIRRRLLDIHGESPQTLREVAASLLHLARTHRAAGTPDRSEEARGLLAEAADLERRRVELYGIPAGDQPGLLIVLAELSSLLQEMHDEKAAATVLEEIATLQHAPGAVDDADEG